MAACIFSYHMNDGCAFESDLLCPKPYWSMGLRNTQPVIVHRVSKRAVSVGFFFHAYQLLLHTYMMREVTTTRIKLCGFVWMDLSTVCIHSWLSPKDPWAVSSSIQTINQSKKYSISMQTSKLEMRCKFSKTLCTQANQHKMKTVKNSCIIGVQSLKESRVRLMRIEPMVVIKPHLSLVLEKVWVGFRWVWMQQQQEMLVVLQWLN